MSGDKDLQRKTFEEAVKKAAASIKEILSAVTDAEHLTAAEVSRGFTHLSKALDLIEHQALNENAIARTANFSLDQVFDEGEDTPAIEPVAPVVNKPSRRKRPSSRVPEVTAATDAELDLSPDVEVVGKMGAATLVHKEGKATLRVVGPLPPETGRAAPITEENIQLLQE